MSGVRYLYIRKQPFVTILFNKRFKFFDKTYSILYFFFFCEKLRVILPVYINKINNILHRSVASELI